MLALSTGFAWVAIERGEKQREKRAASIKKGWETRIHLSEFSDADKLWLIETIVPTIAQFSLAGRRSSQQFYQLNKLAISMNYLPAAVSAVTLVIWREYATWGLAVIAVLGTLAAIAVAFDALEQNSLKWQDASDISGQLCDAIDELLSDTPGIPLTKQVDRFSSEYRQIMQLARRLERERIDKAQKAASTLKEEVKERIETERKQYRSEFENVVSNTGTDRPTTDIPVGAPQPRSDVGGSGAPTRRGDALSVTTLDRIAASPDVWNSGDGGRANPVTAPTITQAPETVNAGLDRSAVGSGDWVEPGSEQTQIEGAGTMTPEQFANFSMGGDEESGVFKGQESW